MRLRALAVALNLVIISGVIHESAAADASHARADGAGKSDIPDKGRGAKSGALMDKPNIVFILTDDQDVTMDAITPMTNTLNLLGKQGMTFNNMFTSSPLCCPSRSSILTGNYIHNHGAMNNSIDGNCSSVAWQQGPEKKTFATHVKSAGYKTFFSGKYLNRYGGPAVGGLAHVPPGWDEWIALQYNSVYYNYSLSVNGKEEKHGDDYHKDYLTDLIHNRSMDFLKQQDGSSPFFMMMSTPACHAKFISAPQYDSQFVNKKAPRGPSFNIHSTDKHWLIRQAVTPMSNESLTYLDDTFRKRWRTLLSVDDMVKDVVTLLDTKKLLDKTFIIFSSDNGFHLGQFSLPNDKRQLYEFDIRVPLIVRGPGIPAASKSDNVVANIDIMPTIVDMATGTAPSDVDGMSLMPLLIPKKTKAGSKAEIPWREAILIEHQGEYNPKGYTGCKHTEFLDECTPSCVCEDSRNNTYTCLRSLQPDNNSIYCEFSDTETCYPSCVCEDGRNNTYTCVRTLSHGDNYQYCNLQDNENFQEFYNLTVDPHQLTNIVGKLDPKFVTAQNEKLILLSICKGPSCRQVVPPSKHGRKHGA